MLCLIGESKTIVNGGGMTGRSNIQALEVSIPTQNGRDCSSSANPTSETPLDMLCLMAPTEPVTDPYPERGAAVSF